MSTGATLTLQANVGNTFSGSSTALGSPSALAYADASTSNIVLQSDYGVTFANATPTSGTGSGAVLNYTVGPLTNVSNQILTLGTAGFATYQTYINVAGSNGYTLQIPQITSANSAFLNLNATTGNLSIPGGIGSIGTLTVSGASNTSIGTITGTGPVVKTGTGTFTLTGSNTYTGATNISAGTLAIGSGASISANSTITVGSGAKLDITANPAFTLASGATLTGTGTVVGPYTHSAGTLNPGGIGTAGTLSFSSNLSLAGGAVTFDLSGSNASTGGIYNDLIAVTGNLNLTGTTPISLNMLGTTTVPNGSIYTVITYTGSLSNTGGGSLSLPSDLYQILPLASTPGKVEIEYSTSTVQTLVWQGNNGSSWDVATTPNWVSGSSPALFNNADNVVFNDSTGVQTTSVSVAANVSPGSIVVNSSANGNNYTISGPGSITGTTGLTKLGTSTLTLSGSNTYTGTTNVSGGTLIVTNTTGSGIGTGPTIIGAGATLQVGDGGADGAIQNGNTDTNTITDNGVLAFNSSSTNLNPPVLITGTGSLFINASMGIGNHNTYSGGTTIAGGDVIAYENDSFGTGTVNVNGGAVDVQYGAKFLNNFNMSGTALIEQYFTAGTGIAEIDGVVNLTGSTTLQMPYGGSIKFYGSPTALTGTNQSLTVTGGSGYSGTFSIGGNVNLGTGTISVGSGITLQFAPPASTTISIPTAIVSASAVQQSGLGTTILSGSNTYAGGTNVGSGTLVLASSGAFPSATTLTIASGATVQVANHGSGSTFVPVISSLSNSGTIDITNNALDIQGGSISTISQEVAAAYNGGAWNGSNSSLGVITSSLAASDPRHLTAVGVATNLSTFEGQSVSTTDVLVKYTYYGDANLDGKVDGSDYSMIDNGYLMQLTGWQNGDFNYDGVINGSDYTLIDNAYNTQGAQLAAETASATAQFAGGTAAVPEPSVLGLIGFGLAGLLGRRRRQ
jgi:autotransporter-associated beta strand protein